MMNILLIHGLGRTSFSLMGMSNALKQAGHQPEFFSYTALLESFDAIAQRLRDRLRTLSTLGPYGIVSHSMGAILTRAALAQADFPLPAHVVMLAPPNQSPQAARLVHSLPTTSLLFAWFSGQCGHNLANPDFYAQLPPLDCPYTLIAGTLGPTGSFTPFGEQPNDWIVGLNEVRMRPDDLPIEVPALHSFIMNDNRVKQLTVKAFSQQ
jgi:pimeloyl-ACP methyl ester carboxylesterase